MAALAVILVLAGVLALAAYVWMGRGNKRPEIKLPGPPGWPLLGNFIPYYMSKRPDLVLIEWAKQYGPVYKMKLFGATFVVAATYEACNEVLVTKGKSFSGRGQPFRRRELFHGMDVTSADPRSPQWRPMRNVILRLINKHGEQWNVMEQMIQQLTDEFVLAAKKYGGQPVDPLMDIYRFAIKMAITLLTGNKPEDEDALVDKVIQFERSVAIFSTTGMELDFFPLLRYFGHPQYKKLSKACRLHSEFWQEMWEGHVKAPPSGDEDPDNTYFINSASQLLDAKSNKFQPQVNRDNIKYSTINIIVGSVSTTANSIYGLLNILLHYPEVYKRLQQEVDSVLGVGRATADLSGQMPYTNAVIFETFRFTSIVPQFPHATIEDTTLMGYDIPARTLVLPLFGAVHHDKAFWGDPEVFRPERFLADDGSLLPPDHPNRKRVLSFGAGPRVCPGEVFALKRLFMFITSALQAFDLQPDGELVTCNPLDYTDGTLLSQPSFKVKFIARN